MYAIELNGAHVQRNVKLTYRFKTDNYDRFASGYLNEVRHMAGGELWIKLTTAPTPKKADGAFRVPFDAEVEFL